MKSSPSGVPYLVVLTILALTWLVAFAVTLLLAQW